MWIRVEDQKPKDREKVLVAILSNPSNADWSYTVHALWYHERGDGFRDAAGNGYNPTYWMPLPDPPPMPVGYAPLCAEI